MVDQRLANGSMSTVLTVDADPDTFADCRRDTVGRYAQVRAHVQSTYPCQF